MSEGKKRMPREKKRLELARAIDCIAEPRLFRK
jgi:hypothetical protein